MSVLNENGIDLAGMSILQGSGYIDVRNPNGIKLATLQADLLGRGWITVVNQNEEVLSRMAEDGFGNGLSASVTGISYLLLACIGRSRVTVILS